MISYRHRFHGYNALRGLYAHGKTYRAGSLGLRVASNPKRSDYRLAVVVSKKVNKSAVKRNRLRRRLYEAVRPLAPEFSKAYDMAITVYDESMNSLTAGELTDLVTKLLKQAKIID